jgi:hypothetical protein
MEIKIDIYFRRLLCYTLKLLSQNVLEKINSIKFLNYADFSPTLLYKDYENREIKEEKNEKLITNRKSSRKLSIEMTHSFATFNLFYLSIFLQILSSLET